MPYMHIDNLTRDPSILMMRECYALEKVHGTSAHIKFDPVTEEIELFPGGVSMKQFVETLPAPTTLAVKFVGLELEERPITVYGEAYGGKCQKMKDTYGDKLCFIVFEVQIGDYWLSVPDAEEVAKTLGLEFVPYTLINADMRSIDAYRDAFSVVAMRRDMGGTKIREGIVLRPIVEMQLNGGKRIIAKHKRPEFAEQQHPPKVKQEPTQAMVDAQEIAEEYVVPMRLTHVLDKIPGSHTIETTGDVMRAMVANVEREAEGEIVLSKEARKAISRKAAVLYKDYLKEKAEVE